jgi:hypothetical protein
LDASLDAILDATFRDDTILDASLDAILDADFIHPLLNGVFLGGGCRQFVGHKILEK